MSWSDIRREAAFVLRKKSVPLLLLAGFALSLFAVWTGTVEVAQQQTTIGRLLEGDKTDRQEVTHKHNDYGYIAYYTFHLTYAPPAPLAFAALGVRDVYPWKHRIRMLALEGQIHESDTQNPELALAGKIDFTFVIAVFAPLLLILLLHDLRAAERAAGRHDFLVVTARTPASLWPLRAGFIVLSLWLALSIPFVGGAVANSVPIGQMLLVSTVVLVYLLVWAAICYWVSRFNFAAPVLASLLLGGWLSTTFIVPAVGDVLIEQAYHGPEGGDILMTQREAVNGAWDLPHETTMDAFVASHPQWQGKTQTNSLFEWKWYYAFQQVGDEKALPLARAYQRVAEQRYAAAGWVALLSPAALLQRALTNWAQTDARAAWQYEREIRAFHADLREFYYPFLFNGTPYSAASLAERPQFTPNYNTQNYLERSQ
ncbi:DUF3526 domain-containing protein [Alteromonas lipolytica]|uniref:ABC transporter permease n=1 Tax=Alteromonas lipolytica TaxID=1856405 RepID=A0A1E8FCK2_9ALTE|nr:DUF3526 domain-containing protein [Alteromonas lipolytica]OFI33338.1 hypothetical protein BFC17_03490 [Alteromonas lipolytica]GGF60598.1 ABC transporter permease [Alteromonas lipolytica]